MKKVTRFFSLLLAIAMVLAMNLGTLTVSAATDTSTTDYTIKITTSSNDTATHTYAAYQVFAGNLDGSTLSDITWGSGFESDTKSAEFLAALKAATSTNVTVADDQGADTSVTLASLFASCSTAADVAQVLSDNKSSDGSLARAFADLVGTYMTANATTASGSGTVTITVTGSGYYFVKDSADLSGTAGSYTKYILEVVKDVEINAKADIPTVEKKVYEPDYTDSNYTDKYGLHYNDIADYSIGDDVPFELIGTMPSTLSYYSTYSYTFHDTLSSGLTLNESSIVVEIDGNTVDSSCYTVTVKTDTQNLTLDCSFEISFSDILSTYVSGGTLTDNPITVTSASKVVVKYTAELNSSAVARTGYENDVYLEYSNNPYSSETGKTEKDTVVVFTYELDVTKTDENGDPLGEAKFVLYYSDGSNHYAILDSSNKVTGWTTDSTQATTLESDGTTGKFTVIGLNDGTYYLEETEAPDGYNKLTSPVTLVISSEHGTAQQTYIAGDTDSALTALSVTVNGTDGSGSASTGIVSADVENQSGAVLPSTGGMGTKIFYTLGGILVIGAGVLLIVKRRMRNA
ncbi:MAG: isopeptide-forming domain-containing fimbrial protein [Clostridiales bacterium]|nr:isopeptide-forming domain-containing fimbrial protein [Clostridiales bacterium]